MVEWSNEYYTDPSTTGLNAVYRSTEVASEDPPVIQSKDLLRPSRSGTISTKTSDSGVIVCM